MSWRFSGVLDCSGGCLGGVLWHVEGVFAVLGESWGRLGLLAVSGLGDCLGDCLGSCGGSSGS
eukprot:10827323-Karenia_brevis.AAC.1